MLRPAKNIATLNGHSGDVNSVAFSPDRKFLASGSSDKTIKLWDVAASRHSHVDQPRRPDQLSDI